MKNYSIAGHEKCSLYENKPNERTKIRWALTSTFVAEYIRDRIRYAREYGAVTNAI